MGINPVTRPRMAIGSGIESMWSASSLNRSVTLAPAIGVPSLATATR